MNDSLQRVARGFAVLGAIAGLGWAVTTSTEFARAAAKVDASVGGVQTHQGHFVNANLSDFPWTLAPTLASTEALGTKLTIKMAEKPYTPSSAEGLDDYHCFVVDPKFVRDGMVTGVNIKPGNAKVVHHVILYKMEGANIAAAKAKNEASGGEGWTCFGGPNVTTSLNTTGGGASWLGAWAPGAGGGAFPAGLGVPVKAGSLIVMQVHYNLANGAQPDLSSAELTIAPPDAKLQPLRTKLLYAPVEVPCAMNLNTPECQRENVIQENAKKFGVLGELIPRLLLSACKRDLADYKNQSADASRVNTACDNPITYDATLYAVAGHMHVRGVDIRMVLNPGTNGARTLLHIPKWDFHWQGNYWFKTPVEVKQGDVVRVSCTFDNSTANQPIFGDKPATPRYITWGEGTADEMCLGLLSLVPKQ
jgi:hypothetical protein